MKHTPGPWEARIARLASDLPAFGYTVKAGDKFHSIANVGVYEHEPITVSHPVPKEIAHRFYTPQELEANARLIAAAPDLLEALEIVKDMATAMRGEDFNLGYEQWQKVHAALKKARGE